MRIILTLLAAVGALFAAGEYSNRRAPGFSIADSHFEQHDPQDFRGKVLIVDIMATGCPTCAQVVDTLVRIKAKYGDKIGIISVVTMPDTIDIVDRFVKDHKVTWPFVFDSGQMIASYLKVTPMHPQVHFPHLFVIDPEGMIRNDFEGQDEEGLSFNGMSVEIDKLLK